MVLATSTCSDPSTAALHVSTAEGHRGDIASGPSDPSRVAALYGSTACPVGTWPVRIGDAGIGLLVAGA
eukprot:1392396-Rhodomonas_salina.4